MVKAMTLTGTESLAVLDVHCCIECEHDTKVSPRVVRRNADDLRAVAADNGFQDWYTEYEIATLDIEYLVHYAVQQRRQPRTARSSVRRAIYSGGWQKHPTRQSSECRTPPCVRRSSSDSFVNFSPVCTQQAEETRQDIIIGLPCPVFNRAEFSGI